MSKEIIINPATKNQKSISISYSSIDDIETLKYKIAASLKIPHYFLKLVQTDSTLEEEYVSIHIPFKRVIRKIPVANLENVQVSFNTLQNIVTEHKDNYEDAIAHIKIFLQDTDLDEKHFVCIYFYYLFNKPDNADFIRDTNSEIYRKDPYKIISFTDIVKKNVLFGTEFSFVMEYERFMIKLKAETKDTLDKYTDNNELVKLLKENKEKATKIKESFSKDRTKFINTKYILKNIKLDELELFEKMRLSRNVPYITLSEFSKVLKSFSPPDEFFNHKDDIITMFVFNKKNETPTINPSHYSVIKIKKIMNDIEIYIESKIDGINYNIDVKEEVIVQRIIYALNIDNIISDIECDIIPQFFKGEFYIPLVTISRVAMHDIIMINKFISKMFAVNEQFTTFNKKGGIAIVYTPSDTGNKKELTTCSLSNGIVSSANKRFIKGTSLETDDEFVAVSFKTKNNYTLNILRECLSHLFAEYNKEESKILKEYSNINLQGLDCSYESEKKEIDKLEMLQKKKSGKKKVKLSDYLPELFRPGYGAQCGKPSQPRIIESDKEAEERIKKGEDIMLYPLYDEFDQYYYSCEHNEENKHPGLKETSLVEYLIPCCYMNKYSSYRQTYEKGEYVYKEEERKTTDLFKIYTTTKIMPIGGIGFLSPNIDRLFKIIDANHQYVRSGVSVSINSCIEAILRTKEKMADKLNNMDKDERKEFLDKYRNNLKEVIQKGASSQNSYLYSQSTLIDILEQDKFIDVRLFHDALQELFKVNIIIFQVTENINGELVSPYYINNYYLLNQKREFREMIILYETMGTRIDNLSYPHYEFVRKRVEEKNKKMLISRFPFDDIITTGLSKAFDDMFMQYSSQLSTKIIKNPFVTRINSQKADSFGKIRILLFEEGTNILIQPSDSFPVSMINNINPNLYLKPIKFEKAIEFIKKEEISNYELLKLENKIVGIYAKKNDVTFHIPTRPMNEEDVKKIKDINTLKIQTNFKSPVFMIEDDILNIYSKQEKSARNLMALVMYLFSFYISTTSKSISDDKLINTILDFKNEKLKVDETISENIYFNIKRKFLDNDFIKDGVIVLNSNNLLKKVIYNILIKTKQNSRTVLNYNTLVYIPDFYQDVRDFEKDEDCIFFTSYDAVIKWKQITSRSIERKVFSYINEEFIKSLVHDDITLFSNKNVTNDELYFCVSCTSIYTACSIIDYYNSAGNIDTVLAKSKIYENKEITKTFKGKMISSEDADLSELKVSTYGKRNDIILVFKYENSVFVLSLFKYKQV
jgi:hypothetical protein